MNQTICITDMNTHIQPLTMVDTDTELAVQPAYTKLIMPLKVNWSFGNAAQDHHAN